jgi:hypothetical protein
MGEGRRGGDPETAHHTAAAGAHAPGLQANLLMAILSFPSMPKLNVTHKDLEDWFRWFWGRDIADRRPGPSEQVFLYAERNARREIHNDRKGLRAPWDQTLPHGTLRQKGNNPTGHQLSHSGREAQGDHGRRER